MKINQFNSQNATNAAITFGGVATGTMGSRVIAEKLPVFKDKPKMKAGLLLAVGFGLATLVDNKDEAGKFVQGVGVGMATTQGIALLKEVIDPKKDKDGKNSLIGVAVGMNSPAETYVVYDNSYAPSAIETSYYDYDQENFAMASPELEFSMA